MILLLFQAAAKKAEGQRKRELQESQKAKELAAFLSAGEILCVCHYCLAITRNYSKNWKENVIDVPG